MVEPRRTSKMEKPGVRLDAASVAGQTGLFRMNREILIAQFDRLLPLAAKWAVAVETRILRRGVPLTEESLADSW